MSKSLDRVLQPDGSYKWEVVELTPPSTVAKPEVKEVEKTNDFESMTKKELEAFDHTIGIELDKRHTKGDLIAELEKFTSPE